LPGKQGQIKTGIYAAVPSGFVGIIKERSSLSVKRCYAHAGVIDSSYRGEIVVILGNYGNAPLVVEPGDRVAQMIIVPHLDARHGEQVAREALGQTVRNDKGFGSTGK